MSRRGPIVLAHGAGGRLTAELVRDRFLPKLNNAHLAPLSDSAILPPLPPGRPALTTDGFVVDPPLFPGGDLGYLAVCGTVNDLAVAGARPLWLSWALILEEGCDGDLLDTCVAGAARAAEEAGVELVTGDTKVVPRGKGDRIYAVTTGLGVVPEDRDLGDHRVAPGDAVLVTGPLGDHGATIMACRHGMAGGGLQSDCAPLANLVEALLGSGAEVHALHDPTRGGLATVCHEVATRAAVRMELDETLIPVRAEAAAVCELLGLDPLYLACEGRALIWVAGSHADVAVRTLQAHPLGREAAAIGHVTSAASSTGAVVVRTAVGGVRPLDVLSGFDLPRIC